MGRAPWVAHFALTRTPFSKSIAAKDLYARLAHAEAVARISFCVAESALGAIFGDVGVGKTVPSEPPQPPSIRPTTRSSILPIPVSGPGASMSPSFER